MHSVDAWTLSAFPFQQQHFVSLYSVCGVGMLHCWDGAGGGKGGIGRGGSKVIGSTFCF